MHVLNFLIPALSLLSATAAATKTYSHTVELLQWPLGEAAPTPLATVTYDPHTGEGEFVGAAHNAVWSSMDEDAEVRVGVMNGESWFGGVVKGKALKYPDVILRVDNEGRVWHVTWKSGDGSVSKPIVRVLPSVQGAQPVLNKPIVLTADGKVPVPEVEKTFLQKYWWVLLGATLLIMTSGGAE